MTEVQKLAIEKVAEYYTMKDLKTGMNITETYNLKSRRAEHVKMGEEEIIQFEGKYLMDRN